MRRIETPSGIKILVADITQVSVKEFDFANTEGWTLATRIHFMPNDYFYSEFFSPDDYEKIKAFIFNSSEECLTLKDFSYEEN